jgi:hypothetical protein
MENVKEKEILANLARTLIIRLIVGANQASV